MLTEEEKKAIDPKFCADGLNSILKRLYFWMKDYEMAAIYGAISLLRDEPVDEWLIDMAREDIQTLKEKGQKGLWKK